MRRYVQNYGGDLMGRKNFLIKKIKWQKSFLRSFFAGILMLILICIAGVSVGLAWYISKISKTLPSDEEILSYQANEASIVYDRKKRVITELFTTLPKTAGRSSSARFQNGWSCQFWRQKDSEFYSHKGIRPMAILRSLLTGEGGQRRKHYYTAACKKSFPEQ